jgi:hypothetical protein
MLSTAKELCAMRKKYPTTLTVTVKNFHKYNPPKNYATTKWVKIDTRILEDPKVAELKPTAKLLYFAIILECGKQQQSRCTFNTRLMSTMCSLRVDHLHLCANDLEQLQLLTIEKSKSDKIREDKIRKDTSKEVLVVSAKKAKSDPCPYQDLIKLWAEKCPKLPQVRTLTEARKKHLRSRWRENSDLTIWSDVLDRISKSKFCNGDNDRGWCADIDFLLRPDTITKVLEGKYDSKEKVTDDALASLRRKYADV